MLYKKRAEDFADKHCKKAHFDHSSLRFGFQCGIEEEAENYNALNKKLASHMAQSSIVILEQKSMLERMSKCLERVSSERLTTLTDKKIAEEVLRDYKSR
jgi:hypothetical protein